MAGKRQDPAWQVPTGGDGKTSFSVRHRGRRGAGNKLPGRSPRQSAQPGEVGEALDAYDKPVRVGSKRILPETVRHNVAGHPPASVREPRRPKRMLATALGMLGIFGA